MSTPALDLMEDAITQLRDAGRVSEAAWTVARRVIDLSRGVVPKDQWQTVHQEVVGYGHQLDRTRTPTSDTDRRVSTLLGKSLNGDAQGMLQDIGRLLLQAYQDALATSAERR